MHYEMKLPLDEKHLKLVEAYKQADIRSRAPHLKDTADMDTKHLKHLIREQYNKTECQEKRGFYQGMLVGLLIIEDAYNQETVDRDCIALEL